MSLSSLPTHVLPVLSIRKLLCILCEPPKFHNLPLRGNIIIVLGVSDVGYALVIGNSSTGGWFGILGGTHEKDCVLFMSRLTNSLGFILQDCNRVMEHTRFFLLTRSTSAEGCCLRIEREARKVAECTSYFKLLSFSPPIPTPRDTTRSNEGRRMDLRHSFRPLI